MADQPKRETPRAERDLAVNRHTYLTNASATRTDAAEQRIGGLHRADTATDTTPAPVVERGALRSDDGTFNQPGTVTREDMLAKNAVRASKPLAFSKQAD